MIRSLVRTLAFISTWRAGVFRQPGMVLIMIAGPFLILFLFGIGSTITVPPPSTIVVQSPQSTDPTFGFAPRDLSGYLQVVQSTDSLDHALAELRAQRTQLVVVMPDRPAEAIRAGQKSHLKVYVNEIDPVALAFIRIDIQSQMAIVNNAVGQRVIDSSKSQLTAVRDLLIRYAPLLRIAGVPADQLNRARDNIELVLRIPGDVLVAPFDADVQNIAPQEPTVAGYFVPAALALVIQHLAVTLAGLSMVRARLFGIVQLWQISPVRLGEILAGHYLSYAILTLVVSAILILLVLWALATPMIGPPLYFWLSIVLLALASLGYGFVISMLAHNEQTAAQAAMLILLASIFLGGLIRPLESMTPAVRAVAYLLPATYELQILHDVMLRGETGNPAHFLALGAIALLGLLVSGWLLGRELRPR